MYSNLYAFQSNFHVQIVTREIENFHNYKKKKKSSSPTQLIKKVYLYIHDILFINLYEICSNFERVTNRKKKKEKTKGKSGTVCECLAVILKLLYHFSIEFFTQENSNGC